MLELDGDAVAFVLRFGERDGGFQNSGISGHHELLAKRLYGQIVHRYDEISQRFPTVGVHFWCALLIVLRKMVMVKFVRRESLGFERTWWLRLSISAVQCLASSSTDCSYHIQASWARIRLRR